jgi:hypothetical protein
MIATWAFASSQFFSKMAWSRPANQKSTDTIKEKERKIESRSRSKDYLGSTAFRIRGRDAAPE